MRSWWGVAVASAVAAGLWPGLAGAHDAQRVKLVCSVEIAAAPAKVWAVIGQFQDLSWDRAVAGVSGKGGNTPDDGSVTGATRTVTLKSGVVLPNEELTRYEPGRFTYATFLPHVDVTRFAVTNYSSVLVVTPGAGGGSHVEWRSAFYRGYPNFGPPPGQDEAAAFAAVRAMVQPALDGLKQRMEGVS